MTKQEIAKTIKESKTYLKQNWYIMTPHKRDDLKYKIRLLIQKLKE